MKNKWVARIAFVCVIGFLIYWGYGYWNSYLDEQETLVGAEWVVPLSEDYTYWDDYIRILNNGLEKVNLKLVFEENKDYEEDFSFGKEFCGVKDSQGKIIVPAKYERLTVDKEQGYILAGNDDTNKYHYYNFDGTDFIKGDFLSASKFENGYACVEKGDLHSVIDDKGKEIFNMKCEYLNIFDSEKGLFGFQGDEENSNEYKDIFDGHDWGIVDIHGNIVLEDKYDVIERSPSGDRILAIYTSKNGGQDRIYLDSDFQQVSKKSYEDATAFERGVATVRDEKGWCIINENEEVISRISRCKYMSGFSEGIASAEFNKEIKYYDREGKVLFSIEKGFNQEVRSAMSKIKEGKVTFRGKNGKLGYMDTKGNVIVKPIFTDADIVENGEAFVELGRRSGVIKF